MLYICHNIYRKKSTFMFQVAREGFTRVSTNLAENITGMRVVVAFNRQSPNLSRFNSLQVTNTENNMNNARIAGLYQPTAGAVLFEGKELGSRRSRAERRRIQIVFQDPYSSLNPRMTVRQALAELLRVHQVVPPDRVDARCQELLDKFRCP